MATPLPRYPLLSAAMAERNRLDAALDRAKLEAIKSGFEVVGMGGVKANVQSDGLVRFDRALAPRQFASLVAGLVREGFVSMAELIP